MDSIDDIIADEEEYDRKFSPKQVEKEVEPIYEKAPVASSDEEPMEDVERTKIGEIESFFGKISVAAISLVGNLSIGDTIEIGEGAEKVTTKISSMQIEKIPVPSAYAGDSVGIKVPGPVKAGSIVYKI